MIVDLEESRYLHVIIQDLKAAGISVDSMAISTSKIGDSVSVYLILHTGKATENTEIYEIITRSDKVESVDFL